MVGERTAKLNMPYVLCVLCFPLLPPPPSPGGVKHLRPSIGLIAINPTRKPRKQTNTRSIMAPLLHFQPSGLISKVTLCTLPRWEESHSPSMMDRSTKQARLLANNLVPTPRDVMLGCDFFLFPSQDDDGTRTLINAHSHMDGSLLNSHSSGRKG